MKKLLLILTIFLFSLFGYSQVVPITSPRNADAVLLIDENGNTFGIKQTNGVFSVVIDSIPEPYYVRIAEGDIPGYNSLYKFGSNPAVGTDEETIWQEGGLYPWADVDAAAGIVKVSSSSTDDDVGGTGALTCTIYGLNATTGVEQNESIILTGQTAVNSTLEHSRVFRIIVNTAGTGLKNAGVIYVGTGTVTTGVPAVKWSTVAAGKNQTLQAIWTVPTGKTFYITSFFASTNSNKGNILNIYVRPSGELFQIKTNAYLFSNSVVKHFDFPFALAAGTDIDCRAMGIAVGAGIQFSFERWTE
jgi:hypothetical protein